MMRLTATLGLSCLGAAMLLPGIAVAELQWNLNPAGAAPGHAISDLHLLVMFVITVIFVGVFVFMFYAIHRHRKSLGHEGAHFHANTTVEIVWTAIPLLIIIGMAWPATRTLLEIRDTSAPDITIKVTNYQQKTGYEYLDDGVKFYSSIATPREQVEGGAENSENRSLEVDKPMVVPIGRKVRVLFMSNDVLHTRDVPEPVEKQDAIPGVTRDAWFRADTTGTYHVPCAQFCGSDSDLMPIVVKVVSEDDYKVWLALQKEPAGAGNHDSAKAYRIARRVDMLLHDNKQNSMMAAWGRQLNELKSVAAITYERNVLAACRT
jgi:cytochrome c oxidase subunit 2